jgi:hypothetical protein
VAASARATRASSAAAISRPSRRPSAGHSAPPGGARRRRGPKRRRRWLGRSGPAANTPATARAMMICRSRTSVPNATVSPLLANYLAGPSLCGEWAGVKSRRGPVGAHHGQGAVPGPVWPARRRSKRSRTAATASGGSCAASAGRSRGPPARCRQTNGPPWGGSPAIRWPVHRPPPPPPPSHRRPAPRPGRRRPS